MENDARTCGLFFGVCTRCRAVVNVDCMSAGSILAVTLMKLPACRRLRRRCGVWRASKKPQNRQMAFARR